MKESDEKTREAKRLASEARHAAEAQLIDNHRDEYDRLYAIAASARGIRPRPRKKT